MFLVLPKPCTVLRRTAAPEPAAAESAENGKAETRQTLEKPISEWAGTHPPKPQPAKRPKTVGRKWLELQAEGGGKGPR